MVTIDEISLAADPGRWREAGFRVQDDSVELGSVVLRLDGTGAGKGILGWSLRGAGGGELDGLGGERSQAPERERGGEHPNGIAGLDHVVAMTPALDRTIAALSGAGFELRRVREEPTPAGAPRQAFFRLADVILEVVQEPRDAILQGGGPERPARLWGIAMVTLDIEATARSLGELCGEVRAAVQPGRRIATLRREAGLGVPVAVMSPVPATAAAGA